MLIHFEMLRFAMNYYVLLLLDTTTGEKQGY